MKKKILIVFACVIVIAVGAFFLSDVSVISPRPIYMEKVGPMTRAERKIIRNLIIKTIQDGLEGKKISYPDLNAYPLKWRALKTVYTTLYIGNKLRGCRGNLNQKKPFLHAIVDSAYDAAFQDMRFSKLTRKEFEDPNFYFYITVLGQETPLSFVSEKDIIQQMIPFQSAFMLSYQSKDKGQKRGLFLPSVWIKYPFAQQFWYRLKNQAHIKKDFFSNQFQVYSFSAETIRDLDFTIQQDAQRIQKALAAYKKLFQKNGRIQYEVNFKTGQPSDKTHLVREMGSGYGLAYAYYITHDEASRPIMSQFLKYMRTITIPYQDGVLIADNPDKIDAGASALALLAVLYYEQESKDTSFGQLREGLKNGLIALFEKGVGVHISPNEKGTSPFYDGETWLALTMYQIFYPEDKKVADLMPDLNKTMYDKYSNSFLYNFFHWGTQAAAHQYAQTQDPMMYDFLQKQLNIYIDTTHFGAGASSCSYAEGLGEAALALRQQDEALYQKVLARLEEQLEAVRLLQDVPLRLNAKGKIHANTKPLLGLFLNKADSLKTRDDATQHCLSALLKAQLVFRDVP